MPDLGLCAGRTGQILNLTSLANDAGIAVNTVKSWLSLLEASYIIFLLQPYFNNFSKRIIKSPKIYFYDTGVASSLLRINNPEVLKTHYLYGALFENLVISEIVKCQAHNGKRPSAFYWRESNGTEIDCIVDKGNNEIIAVEIKGGQAFSQGYLKNLKLFPDIRDKNKIKKFVIYPGRDSSTIKDIQIITWDSFSTLVKEFI
jgi:predicted AAA+ superfamily ATPase